MVLGNPPWTAIDGGTMHFFGTRGRHGGFFFCSCLRKQWEMRLRANVTSNIISLVCGKGVLGLGPEFNEINKKPNTALCAFGVIFCDKPFLLPGFNRVSSFFATAYRSAVDSGHIKFLFYFRNEVLFPICTGFHGHWPDMIETVK